jgi:putative sterol carrier protein
VDGRTIGVLQVDDGRVEMVGPGAPVQASVVAKSQDDIQKILRGELNLVVAALQGRLAMDGDTMFALKVLRGLLAGSPVAGRIEQGG